jgi:hypothetical protein
MDAVYLGADLKIGALEIGSKKNDDIKDISDGYYKLLNIYYVVVKCNFLFGKFSSHTNP